MRYKEKEGDREGKGTKRKNQQLIFTIKVLKSQPSRQTNKHSLNDRQGQVEGKGYRFVQLSMCKVIRKTFE